MIRIPVNLELSKQISGGLRIGDAENSWSAWHDDA